jgi:regulatory protein
MDLLARREHTRLELARKLASRAYEKDVIAVTLDGLEAAGLLDATRFADSFIRVRVDRGHGPRRIRSELAARGGAAAPARARLDSAGVDWDEAARRARAKRFGAAVPADYKERARQARFLHYRGFERDQIDAALDLRDVSD